jgi:hypothetical protein
LITVDDAAQQRLCEAIAVKGIRGTRGPIRAASSSTYLLADEMHAPNVGGNLEALHRLLNKISEVENSAIE